MFKAAGFECDTKYLSSASKTLSFIKPTAPVAAVAAAAISNDAAAAAGDLAAASSAAAAGL